MEKEELEYLIEKIVKKLKQDTYFKDIDIVIDKFLNNSLISEDRKIRGIELLYLYQVYKDGYLSLDPRFNEKIKYYIKIFLESMENSQYDFKIEKVEEIIEKLKYSEEHPIETSKKRQEDLEKYGNGIF